MNIGLGDTLSDLQGYAARLVSSGKTNRLQPGFQFNIAQQLVNAGINPDLATEEQVVAVYQSGQVVDNNPTARFNYVSPTAPPVVATPVVQAAQVANQTTGTMTTPVTSAFTLPGASGGDWVGGVPNWALLAVVGAGAFFFMRNK